MDNIKVFYLFAPFTLNMVNMIRKEFKQIKRAQFKDSLSRKDEYIFHSKSRYDVWKI